MKNSFPSRSGFLLAESVVSLAICSLAFVIIGGTLINLDNDSRPKNTLRFYKFIDNIESDRFQFQLQAVSNGRVKLYSLKTHKDYYLERYKDMLRITGKTEGHIQALVSVDNVSWQIKNNHLKVGVEFDDHKRYYSITKIKKTKSAVD